MRNALATVLLLSAGYCFSEEPPPLPPLPAQPGSDNSAKEKPADGSAKKPLTDPGSAAVAKPNDANQLRGEAVASAGDEAEEKGRALLERARKIAALPEPQYAVANALCNAVVQRYPGTKAAAEATLLQAQVAEAAKNQDRIETINRRLKDKAKPYQIAGQWQEAAAVVESDKEFQENRTKLKELESLILDWKAKAGQK